MSVPRRQLVQSIVAAITLAILVSACGSGSSSSSRPEYWPTDGWRSSSPEAQGVDSGRLAEMYAAIAGEEMNLHSLMVIRNGYVVSEAYFHPYTADTLHDIASATKSVTGTLIGIAVKEGLIKDLDQPLLSFYPGRQVPNASAEKEALTLGHLLTLKTGLQCDLTATEFAMQQSANWVAYVLGLPMAGQPGEQWYYCSPATHVLSAVLERATGMNSRDFANEYLFRPLGIDPVEKERWPTDPQGVSRGDIGLRMTTRDLAKLGLLYLQNGQWDGAQLLPKDWVAQASAIQADKGDGTSYGYLWTTYPDQSHYAALGLGGQQLHLFPEKNLIVAVTAALPAYAESPEINTLLNDYILPAVTSESPLPENPAAVAQLQSMEQQAADPADETKAMPDIAQAVSGRVYAFEDNPLGWSTIQFFFDAGSKTASVIVNDAPAYTIGLDGAYRINQAEDGTVGALRARWLDDRTLAADQLNMGTVQEYLVTFTFDGDAISASMVDRVFKNLDVSLAGAADE